MFLLGLAMLIVSILGFIVSSAMYITCLGISKMLNNIDISESCSYPELCWVKENRKFRNYQPVDLYNHFYIKNNFFEFFETFIILTYYRLYIITWITE